LPSTTVVVDTSDVVVGYFCFLPYQLTLSILLLLSSSTAAKALLSLKIFEILTLFKEMNLTLHTTFKRLVRLRFSSLRFAT